MASDCGWRDSDFFPGHRIIELCMLGKIYRPIQEWILIIKLSAGLADVYVEPNWCYARGCQ
jgi:hypothetical protein